METTLVKLPDELNELAQRVPAEKAQEIQKVLTQIFAGTANWEKQVDAIEVKDIHDSMSIALADVARKNAKNARVHAEKIFDAKREEVQTRMQSDKLEDSLWLKSKQIMQLKFKAIEEKAEWKANFVKRYEAEQNELRVQLRLEKVAKFNSEVSRLEVEHMTDNLFDIFLTGLEKAYNDKIEAEKKIESDRLALIEAERVKQEKIRKENERLRKEAIENQKKLDAEREQEDDTVPSAAQFLRMPDLVREPDRVAPPDTPADSAATASCRCVCSSWAPSTGTSGRAPCTG